jgi:hypothetical protein
MMMMMMIIAYNDCNIALMMALMMIENEYDD